MELLGGAQMKTLKEGLEAQVGGATELLLLELVLQTKDIVGEPELKLEILVVGVGEGLGRLAKMVQALMAEMVDPELQVVFLVRALQELEVEEVLLMPEDQVE